MNKGIKLLLFLSILSTLIALFWNSIPIIRDTVHFVLDPTAGVILDWNASFGLVLVAIIISAGTMLLQKYTTDQQTLKEIKKEQKLLQEEMKKFKGHPEKMLELQKKQFEFIPRTMEITLRPAMYSFIPIVLLLRWFSDYFLLNPIKIFGISWFWAYFILIIVFSQIFRKAFNVA